MNSERSQRRDWQRSVAIGLGRPMSKEEAAQVVAAWRIYNAGAPSDYGGPWPRDFVARFKGETPAVDRRGGVLEGLLRLP